MTTAYWCELAAGPRPEAATLRSLVWLVGFGAAIALFFAG